MIIVIKSWADMIVFCVLLAWIVAFGLMLIGFAVVFIEAYRSPNRKEKLLSLVSMQRGFHLFHPRGPSLIYKGAAIALVGMLVLVAVMIIYASSYR